MNEGGVSVECVNSFQMTKLADDYGYKYKGKTSKKPDHGTVNKFLVASGRDEIGRQFTNCVEIGGEYLET